ncbi:MAG: DUF1573 domain-containing protein [Bacteroidia bacterium]
MKTLVPTLLLTLAMGFGSVAVAQTSSSTPVSQQQQTKSKSKRKAVAKNTKPTSATSETVPVTAAEAAKQGKTITPAVTETAPKTTEAAPAVSPAPANDGTVSLSPTTEQAPAAPLTTISFKEVEFDFGKIKQGETVKHVFEFTNTGTNPLILENVKPSCGCTALDWPHDPIAPGKTGKIEAQFNSSGKMGPQIKQITITLNTTEHLERLTFTGEVVVPEGEQQAQPTPAGGH